MRILCIVLAFLLTGCVSNTKISYFPDQRGPFYCRLSDAPGGDSGKRFDFEVVAINNPQDAFALRNSSTNEIVILSNRMKISAATANPIYEYQWWRRKVAAVKILVNVGIESDANVLKSVRDELSPKYPGASFYESKATDIFVDIYSIWLGSEYTRSPCDGTALDNIPFEVTLPGDDAVRFLGAGRESLQFAGRVLYRDAKTGWRFHRSFSLQRGDFTITE
jgi:hypothetical protein